MSNILIMDYDNIERYLGRKLLVLPIDKRIKLISNIIETIEFVVTEHRRISIDLILENENKK